MIFHWEYSQAHWNPSSFSGWMSTKVWPASRSSLEVVRNLTRSRWPNLQADRNPSSLIAWILAIALNSGWQSLWTAAKSPDSQTWIKRLCYSSAVWGFNKDGVIKDSGVIYFFTFIIISQADFEVKRSISRESPFIFKSSVKLTVTFY